MVLSEIQRPCLTEVGLIKGRFRFQNVLERVRQTQGLSFAGFLSHSPPLLVKGFEAAISTCFSGPVCAAGMSGRGGRSSPLWPLPHGAVDPALCGHRLSPAAAWVPFQEQA